MHVKDALRNSLAVGDRIINSYLGDLDDADLLVRAVPGMNHAAWQLGHLIGTERHILEMIRPGSCPALPDDFEEGHGRHKFDVDDPSKFYSKSKYLEIWKKQREATLAVLDSLSDSDFDRTDERFPPVAATVGKLLGLCCDHPIIHAGQFVAVRRKLNKPITI